MLKQNCSADWHFAAFSTLLKYIPFKSCGRLNQKTEQHAYMFHMVFYFLQNPQQLQLTDMHTLKSKENLNVVCTLHSVFSNLSIEHSAAETVHRDYQKWQSGMAHLKNLDAPLMVGSVMLGGIRVKSFI